MNVFGMVCRARNSVYGDVKFVKYVHFSLLHFDFYLNSYSHVSSVLRCECAGVSFF